MYKLPLGLENQLQNVTEAKGKVQIFGNLLTFQCNVSDIPDEVKRERVERYVSTKKRAEQSS